MTEEKPSLKIRLALFAQEKYPNWVNGGEFENFATTLGYKASNGSRRCRELADENTLERRINGKSVEYRYKAKESQPERNPTNYRCSKCNRDAVTFKDSKSVCQAHSVREVVPSLF